ncbi:hypothetical protein [Umezawaea sp. Da 62-37]|uniref:hypothetical protein n=1 Tax=Umezawaea sp. Da 62-37 TaxID=3075927 RepID=UPI0028F73CB0|nr:hypothetical protein [Umezawaea sp. Da 62-37]WNV87334.1 hypothetical protein RM788_03270 [Umezawaea sp. Da 62-37]
MLTRPRGTGVLALSPGRLALLALLHSAVVTWVLSARVPAGMTPAGRSVTAAAGLGHHGQSAVPGPPPICAEPLPHLVGTAVLAAHVAMVLLVGCVLLVREVLRRRGKPHDSLPVRFGFAALTGVAAVVMTPLVASISLGVLPSFRQFLVDAAVVGRYAFLLALVLTVLIGLPWRLHLPSPAPFPLS